MARNVLCVPATAIGVERTFSIARHQSRFNRAYHPETLEAIMVARHKLLSEADIQA